jgi:hypothetical protein
MFKNGFKSVFWVTLIICCFSNEYVFGEVENSKVDQVDSQQVLDENLSAQYVYYKENPWDFVEHKLMTKEGWSNKIAIPLDCGFFLFSSFCSNLGVKLIIGFLNASRRDYDIEKQMNDLAFAFGIIIGVIATKKFHKYMTSPSLRDVIRSEDVISILQSYDPDLNKSNSNNTKLYIPKELHAIFDALWRIYKQQGDVPLKNEWDMFSRFIHDKIIFELKSAKYIKPVTNA